MKLSFNGTNVIAEAESVDESIALLKASTEGADEWFSLPIDNRVSVGTNPLTCGLCGFEAKNKAGLSIHQSRIHEGKSWVSNPSGKGIVRSTDGGYNPFDV